MLNETPVVLLCGGRGILLETPTGIVRLNKGLASVRRTPMFWWLLWHYAFHGFEDFTLAVGSNLAEYREALEFGYDATPVRGVGNAYRVPMHGRLRTVRLVETGETAVTGRRLLACAPLLRDARHFAVTYSDTLADVDLAAEYRFHVGSERTCTLLAAKMPVRFRVLGIRQDEFLVRRFADQPVIQNDRINGGFYFFSRAVWDEPFFGAGQQDMTMETHLLESLAAREQLAAYMHPGEWQHLDGERDIGRVQQVAARIEAMWGRPA